MNQSKQTILTENLEISGKDGNVKCSSMQKHLPETDVLFIKTKSNHFILCQANHPLYVKSNEEVMEKQADKLKAGTDHLWIDNTIAHNGNSEKPSVQPKDLADFIFHSGYDTLNKDDFAAKYRPFLRGECSENLRFEPDFINYDFYWVLEFIERIYENIQNSVFYCRSYILASQIKLLCDRAEFECKVSPIMQGNDLYFIIHVAYSDLDGVFIKDWNMVDQIYRIENYDKFVYDIKTDTNEFMMNCVQNHNSFHSNHSGQLLYVKQSDNYKVISYERLWKKYSNNQIYTTLEGQEEIFIDDLYVWDKDKFTKVKRIIRHPRHPESPMVFIRSNNSDFIVCQDNHPLMLSLNTDVCKNCDIPYIKTKKSGKWVCPSCKSEKNKINHKSDNNWKEVFPSKYVKSKYFSENSFPIWQTSNEKTTIIDPYTFGMFLAEGSYLYYYEGTTLAGIIISQGEGEILSKVASILNEDYKCVINGCETRSTKQLIIYDKDLAGKMLECTKRYSYEKSLGEDYIYYSDECLAKILCGIIDGDGSFINSDRNHISFECTSLELIQQMHHILQKFEIRHNITVATIKPLTRHQSYNIKIYPTKKHKEIFSYSIKCKNNEFANDFNRNRYPSLITYCKPVLFDDNDYVYDLETESHTLTTNGIWAHNSGGAANLKKTDIIGELKKTVESNQESNLESWFKQVDTSLYLTQEICSIELDKSVYSKSGIKIKIENDQIQIPVGYFRIHIRDIYMDSTIENPTVLYIHDFANVSDNGKTLTINYVKNDKIMSVETVILEPENIATMLDGIVGGKSPFKTPEDLYKKMFNFLSPLAGFDSVHLETIVGNVLRNKKSPQYPARIKEPYEYKSVSIKKLPMVQSWSLGLAFEDIGKSITYGLISDRQPASSIEKVMFGEPMSDLAVKRLKELKKR